MKQMLILAALLTLQQPIFAQSDEDGLNVGFLAGYTYAQPHYPALDAFRDRFNSEPTFGSNRMTLDPYASGFSGGFGIYASGFHLGLTYGALQLKGRYQMQPSPTDPLHDYTLRLSMRSFRAALAYGKTWSRYGQCGLYAGAAFYGGNWVLKTKQDNNDYQEVNADDFTGYAFGISPQVSLRLWIVEFKAFYDVPVFNTNMGQLYNEAFKAPGITPVPEDGMRSRMGAYGGTVSLFIPIGASRPRAADDEKPAPSGNGRFEQDLESMRKAQESNRKALERNEREIQNQERSNRREHERQRRGY